MKKIQFIYKLSFKNTIIPSYFEFLVVFILPMIDVIFLSKINPESIGNLAILGTLTIVPILHAQYFSNAAVSRYFANKFSFYCGFYRVFFLVLLLMMCYFVFFITFYDYIFQSDRNYSLHRQDKIFIILMMLSSLIGGCRKPLVAVDFIKEKSRDNFIYAALILVLNIIFNLINYFITFSIETKLIGIGLSTCLSQFIIFIIQLYRLKKSNKIYAASFNLKHDIIFWQSLKWASLSVLEVIGFSACSYLFFLLLKQIDVKLLDLRGFLSPFLMIVTASSVVWAMNANKLLSTRIDFFSKTLYEWQIFSTSSVASLMFAIPASILIVIVVMHFSGNNKNYLFFDYGKYIAISMIICEIFRAVNLMILSIMRQTGGIAYATFFSLSLQAMIGCFWIFMLKNKINLYGTDLVLLLFAPAADEIIRFCANFFIYRRKFLTEDKFISPPIQSD